MHLPPAVLAYFAAEDSGSAERLLQAFAPDAIVTDEGETHSGHPAIEAWWRAAKAKYGHRAEALEADGDGQATKVRARVTGNFPGSPATLTFAFRLEWGRIAQLEIGA